MCLLLLFSRESSLSQYQASPLGREKHAGSNQLKMVLSSKFLCSLGLFGGFFPILSWPCVHSPSWSVWVTYNHEVPKVLFKHFMPHPLSSLLKATTTIQDHTRPVFHYIIKQLYLILHQVTACYCYLQKPVIIL